MVRILLVLALVSPALALSANVPPNCNEANQEDTELAQGAVRAFFEARLKDTACQARYQAAKKAYDEARAEVERAKTDEAEDRAESLRKPYLEALSECGPCAAHPIGEPTVVEGEGRDQYWYKSDGSCLLPLSDASQQKKAYQTLSEMLTHVKAYAHVPGTKKGFNAILDLSAVNPANGSVLPGVDKIGPEKTLLRISIMGPKVLPLAFSYFFENSYSRFEKNGLENFFLKFDGVNKRALKMPRSMTSTSASGKTRTLFNNQLTRSVGAWYVNSSGYLRYCTAADFGGKNSFVQDYGRQILLDTLAQAAEKALE